GMSRPERFGGLEVDDKFELGRQLHWQVGRLLALEGAAGTAASLAVLIGDAWHNYRPRASLTREPSGSSAVVTEDTASSSLRRTDGPCIWKQPTERPRPSAWTVSSSHAAA